MVNAQEYLNKNYPLSQRKEIKELNIAKRYLEGELELNGFVNLERLNCSHNKLTDIVIDDLNSEKLTRVNLMDNKISPRNISMFKSFTQLTHLLIGTTNAENVPCAWQGNRVMEYVQRINYFYGSLESLKGLNKLKYLDVRGTDVNRGLEFLSLSELEVFYCDPMRDKANTKEIYELIGADENMDKKMQKLKEIQSEYHQKNKTDQKAEEKSQLEELANIIMPNSPFDFITMKTELRRLKINDLNSQLQNAKFKLDKSVTLCKNKLSEILQDWLAIFIESHEKIIQGNDDEFIYRQLERAKTNLKRELNETDLEFLLNEQKEVSRLQMQIRELQDYEQ